MDRVVVVSPDDTGIMQARAKTDRLDARALARLLWSGELDSVWMRTSAAAGGCERRQRATGRCPLRTRTTHPNVRGLRLPHRLTDGSSSRRVAVTDARRSSCAIGRASGVSASGLSREGSRQRGLSGQLFAPVALVLGGAARRWVRRTSHHSKPCHECVAGTVWGPDAANSRRAPIPFNSRSPRSAKESPDPATRSRVVVLTSTSPGPAWPMIRAAA